MIVGRLFGRPTCSTPGRWHGEATAIVAVALGRRRGEVRPFFGARPSRVTRPPIRPFRTARSRPDRLFF